MLTSCKNLYYNDLVFEVMNNFKIRVDKIKRQLGLFTIFEYQGRFKDEGIEFLEEMNVHAKITNIGEELLVQGGGGGIVQLTCSRCLQNYSAPITFEFCERFIPREIVEEKPTDWEEDQDNYFVYQGDVINLKELIRQHSIIAIPLKPLCSVECRGFCPSCGQDLNLQLCDCDRTKNIIWKSMLGKIKEATSNG